MRDDMISCLIQLVQETSNLHAYTVQQLYRAMSADISQQPLLQVAAWCIGEFGDQLFTATSDDDEPIQVCFWLTSITTLSQVVVCLRWWCSWSHQWSKSMPGPVDNWMCRHRQIGKPPRYVTSHTGQLSLAIPLWDVNRHTAQCTSMISQCKLMSGWGLRKHRSLLSYGSYGLGRSLVTFMLRLYLCLDFSFPCDLQVG